MKRLLDTTTSGSYGLPRRRKLITNDAQNSNANKYTTSDDVEVVCRMTRLFYVVAARNFLEISTKMIATFKFPFSSYQTRQFGA
jgi:hypothetical protein